jgi:hypothetical protein
MRAFGTLTTWTGAAAGAYFGKKTSPTLATSHSGAITALREQEQKNRSSPSLDDFRSITV